MLILHCYLDYDLMTSFADKHLKLNLVFFITQTCQYTALCLAFLSNRMCYSNTECNEIHQIHQECQKDKKLDFILEITKLICMMRTTDNAFSVSVN